VPRIEQIRKMLEAEPSDVLLNYALALELFNAGQHDEAIEQFDKVIALDPNYSAAYMQKARSLIGLHRQAEARTVLEKGIQMAVAAGDAHAQEKMEELLRALGQ